MAGNLQRKIMVCGQIGNIETTIEKHRLGSHLHCRIEEANR
jgi:hypothetical protein